MGRRGPKPTPEKLLAARGSWRAKRKKGVEAPNDIGEPEKPKGLDAEQGEVWDRMVAELRRLGVLTQMHANPLERYCEKFIRWRGVAAFLRKNGSVYTMKDEAGKVKCVMPFPQVAEEKSLGEALLKLEQEMGLTPAARARVNGESGEVKRVVPVPAGVPVLRIAE